MFTDSHTHLYLKDFDSDLETVIQSAFKRLIDFYYQILIIKVFPNYCQFVKIIKV